MKTLNASDAKREFGDLLIQAQQGPVGINRNGKPVAVVVSATEYARLEALKTAHLEQAIQQGIADLEAGRLHDGEAVFERLHKRIPR